MESRQYKRCTGNKDPPLGENRTTFTAAECRLNVARYSTLGCLGAGASAPALAAEALRASAGRMLGCTIHTYESNCVNNRALT